MLRFFQRNDSDNEEQQEASEELQDVSEEEHDVSEDIQSDSSEQAEPEQKSMADYYNDLEAIIANIRDKIKDADKDPSFRHAAKILSKVIKLCRDIESSINPVAVMNTNSERSKLLKQLGPDGMIEIKGEASRLLASEYRRMMIALANKEYWPNAPILFAPAVNYRYGSELEKRASDTQLRIQKYQERIDAYDQSKTKPKEQLTESQRLRR